MKQIFINLPVEDVNKSMSFYSHLGFTNKALFSDDHQKCMIWSEHIYVMLIEKEKFKSYSKKPIIGSNRGIDAYFTVPVESLDRVNEIVKSGLRAGGREPIAMIDEGYMQIRRLEDYDGHAWDFIFLDEDKFEKNKTTI